MRGLTERECEEREREGKKKKGMRLEISTKKERWGGGWSGGGVRISTGVD